MFKKYRKVKISGFLVLILFLLYLGLLLHPNFLFANHHKFKNFNVYSDKEIPVEINEILLDVESRISNSELYEVTDEFSIYICNYNWRLTLLTRNSKVGGLVNQGISDNIFIRESIIEENKIVSPTMGREIALEKERPLSYFIAHEITHSLQTKIELFMHFNTPRYIVEGYADYIGKGSSFQYDKYLNDFIQNDFTMDTSSGLYNKYHLMIAYLMNKKGLTFYEIVSQKRDLEAVENEFKSEITINKPY